MSSGAFRHDHTIFFLWWEIQESGQLSFTQSDRKLALATNNLTANVCQDRRAVDDMPLCTASDLIQAYNHSTGIIMPRHGGFEISGGSGPTLTFLLQGF